MADFIHLYNRIKARAPLEELLGLLVDFPPESIGGRQLLGDVVHVGSPELLRLMLQRGYAWDERPQMGITDPLQLAIYHNRIDLIPALIEQGHIDVGSSGVLEEVACAPCRNVHTLWSLLPHASDLAVDAVLDQVLRRCPWETDILVALLHEWSRRPHTDDEWQDLIDRVPLLIPFPKEPWTVAHVREIDWQSPLFGRFLGLHVVQLRAQSGLSAVLPADLVKYVTRAG